MDYEMLRVRSEWRERPHLGDGDFLQEGADVKGGAVFGSRLPAIDDLRQTNSNKSDTSLSHQAMCSHTLTVVQYVKM